MKAPRVTVIVSVLLTLLAVFPTASLAAVQTAAEAAPSASVPAVSGTIPHVGSLFPWSSYFHALAILFLLVALLWVLLRYLKNKGALRMLARQGDLEIESRLTLGPKKSLLVVRFLNKRLLLGVTDHQITTLTEQPANDDTDDAAALPDVDGNSFTAHLHKTADHDTP